MKKIILRLFFLTSVTAKAASKIVANSTEAPRTHFNRGNIFKVNSTIIPKVPSAPIIKFVRSYPVEDFRTSRRVLINSPSIIIIQNSKNKKRGERIKEKVEKTEPVGVTTSKDKIFSLVVPYLRVDRPDPEVDAIPPK